MKKSGGSLRHLRREVAPQFWSIRKKDFAWTIKPAPGSHPIIRSIPLGIVLRDILKYTSTIRETRKILAERKVHVDGKVVTDYKFPVGFMDVLYLRGPEEYFRVLPHPSKFFMFHRISAEEANLKPLRIQKKTIIKNNYIQLTFHDGRNYAIKNIELSSKQPYETYDTVLMHLGTKQIIDSVKMATGSIACVIDGRNVGFTGTIQSIQQTFKRSRAVVTLGRGDDTVRTILKYVFVVGKENPLITLPTDQELKTWEELFKFKYTSLL
ncbi:MAG: 30S ribosomal protein S4e [Thermofilaceae archaeon]